MYFGQLLIFDIWLGRAYCYGTFSLCYESLVLFWSDCTNWFECIATNILNTVCQLACWNHRWCTFFQFQVLIVVSWWYFSGMRCRLILLIWMFWRDVLLASSLLYPEEGGTCSFEMSVLFYWTTHCHIWKTLLCTAYLLLWDWLWWWFRFMKCSVHVDQNRDLFETKLAAFYKARDK